MRLSAVFLGSIVASASATLYSRASSSLPTCATDCLSQATSSNDGGCSTTDITCMCSNKQFQTTILQCVESKCSGDDVQTALDTATNLCASAGVTIDTSALLSATAAATSSASTTTTGSSSSASATSSNTNAAHSNTPLFAGFLGLSTVIAWMNV